MSSITNIHDHSFLIAWPREGFWVPPWNSLAPFEVTGRSVHLLFWVYWLNAAPLVFEIWQADPMPNADNEPDPATLRPIEVPEDECRPWGPTKRLTVEFAPHTTFPVPNRMREVSFPNCAKFYVVRPIGNPNPPVRVFALLENLRTKG